MSHRAGYPIDPWARHGVARGAAFPVHNNEPRGLPQSSMQPGTMTFQTGTLRDVRSDHFGAPAQVNPLLAPLHHYPANSPNSIMSGFSGPREGYSSHGPSGIYPIRSVPLDQPMSFSERKPSTGDTGFGPVGTTSGSLLDKNHVEYDGRMRSSPEHYPWEEESHSSWNESDLLVEGSTNRTPPSGQRIQGKSHSQRRPSNRDEFDGPHQLLDRPSAEVIAGQERDLPHLPTNLYVNEQDEILSQVNDRLSKCAFDFIAKYQFPIPLEPDKRPVRIPADREWTEWVYLLKRLATKRRVPARVLYNHQIKQLVTVLENSLEMRHAAKHQSRPLKDDRNVLQLISAGLQVAKILKDASCMEFLDSLYVHTERKIQSRKSVSGFGEAKYDL